jgi:DNA polymerase-3 subunit gamma/tau
MPQHHQIVQPVQPPSTAMAEPALAEPALGGSSDRVPPTPTPPSPPATPAANANATVIDERARRLAEFFNGEVVQLDEPLPGLSGDEAAA